MKNKADRNEKILTIVIVVAVLSLGIYKLFFEKNDIVEEKIDTETISVVKDNSKFYTVSSCVSKYISYLSYEEIDNVLTLLSNNYKKNNSIDSSNIYNYISMLNAPSSFEPKKMLEQRLSKSIYKYYVSGYLQEETLDSTSMKQEYYVIVIMDEKNMTFEIEPYDGSLFK